MTSRPKIPDFDTLMHMFEQDPESYEHFRKRLLEEAVAECPAQYREGMQDTLRRIEAVRQSASTPLEAVAYAARLMRDSMGELKDKLEELQYELTRLQSLLVLHRIKNSSQGPSHRTQET